MDLTELRELLAAINQTDIAELTLKSADFELTVRRGIRADERLYTIATASQEGEMAPLPTSMVFPPEKIGAPLDRTSAAPFAASTSAPKGESLRDGIGDRRLVEVTSPMVGTFYRAPAPDEPAFVNSGERIQVGQTVCIIEAMKLMNEIESEVAGEIVEILVQNGEPVEFGQPLMRVNPS
nr:acetyl-CoA carboxylase biotin carboxyl carrier protein [Leptolyngbya sp. FACHB-36]